MEIIQNFLQYLLDFVEKPNKLFSNLPVCPFAKQARIKGKINFFIADLNDITALKEQITNFTDESGVLWLIHPNTKIIVPEIEQIANSLRIEFKQFEFFTGHPEDTRFTRKEPYPNILVQNKLFLEQKRSVLKKTDYYVNFEDDLFQT